RDRADPVRPPRRPPRHLARIDAGGGVRPHHAADRSVAAALTAATLALDRQQLAKQPRRAQIAATEHWRRPLIAAIRNRVPSQLRSRNAPRPPALGLWLKFQGSRSNSPEKRRGQ